MGKIRIEFERIIDPKILEYILRDEDIFSQVIDDNVPRGTFSFSHEYMKSNICLLIKLNGFHAGVIQLNRNNSILYECHLAMFPEYRKWSKKMGHAALKWIEENTQIKQIFALVSVKRQEVMKLASQLGFKVTGIIPQSYLIGGELVDQLVFTWRA